MDCLQILLNTFFAFLSAVMGVMIGVWYSKREFALARITQKQQLKLDLIKAFKFNIDRLNQMSGQLAKSNIPDYHLDTESVAHVLFNGRQLFDDPKWFDKFNWERFQLVHINAKIDFLNDLTNLSGISQGSIFVQGGVGHSRVASLIARLPSLVSDIQKLLTEFETAKSQ